MLVAIVQTACPVRHYQAIPQLATETIMPQGLCNEDSISSATLPHG